MITEQRPNATRNLVIGAAAKYVLLAVNIVLGALMLPFNVRHLGKADYGLWILVASMTSYFALLDLGYGNGLVRHVTEADARGDVDGMNAILSTFVVVYAVLGAIAFAGIVLMASYAVPAFPHLTAPQVRTGQWVLVLLGLRLAIGFPRTVFGAVTNARQRFAVNTWVAVGVALVNALVTYVVLAAGHGLLTLVPATVALSVLSYVAYGAVARHVFPELRLSVRRFSRTRLKEVTAFSVYLFVISVSAQIGFNLDNLVIGACLGTAAVAVCLIVLVPIACRALEVRVLRFARLAAAPAAAAVLPAAAVAWALRVYVAPASMGAILACGACVEFVYVVAFGSVGLTAADRGRYLQYLERSGRGGQAPLAAAA